MVWFMLFNGYLFFMKIWMYRKLVLREYLERKLIILMYLFLFINFLKNCFFLYLGEVDIYGFFFVIKELKEF